jgi:voltage-gated potassium channel
MATETPLVHFVILLVIMWLLFAAALYLAEQRAIEPVISSYGEALYWGIAAFSTAGIADMPSAPLSQLVGGAWIVVGSVIFFGIIVATVTGYFMRSLQRPVHRLVETIEYNLEHLQDLSVEELDLLKDTVDALILHMERVKQRENDTNNSV